MDYDKSEKTAQSNTNDLRQVISYQQGDTESMQVHGVHKTIKSRHAQMIAIGGTIGTGLFVGAGQALAIGGPGFLLLAYGLTSLLVYGVLTACVEVATYVPLSGSSMAYYTGRFASPSLGFALGWLYFYSFGILVAYESTAAGIVINYWPNDVPIAAFITIILALIIILNFSPVAVYAETEFWFAGVKVITLVGLLLLALILMCGGGPTHDVLGFRYWQDPGAVKEYIIAGSGGRWTAFLYVWVFSGFSFYFGPELIVFTAGEMRSPRKELPTASHHFFYRLMFFYVVGVLALGIICNSNSPELVTGTGNANASPWVIAIKNAGISALPSIINAAILTSAWSAGNSFLYMSSRALYSLALAGHAPKIFTKCTSWGVPVYAVAASSSLGLLAYLNVSSSAGQVFDWFVNLTNTAGYTSWILCSIVLIRFRKACISQQVTVPYKSVIQPYAAYVCIVLFTFLLLTNGFTVFFPGKFTSSGFLTAYIGIPVFLILWLGHKLVAGRSDPWLSNTETLDRSTGVSEVEQEAVSVGTDFDLAEKGRLARALNKATILWK